LLLGLLLFLPAGTLRWWRGWLLMGVLFVPMLAGGLVLMKKSPRLLKKRLKTKEEQVEQKQVILLSGLVFLAAFIVAGLNFRFRWIVLPDWVSWAFAGVFLMGYTLYAEVLRENEWLSRTVEVSENQTVIQTGLYGMVRHPMYLATLLMFLPIPLILGSLWGLLPFALYPVILIIRIMNEEKVLTEKLAGYAEYKNKVKYRLLPFIW